MKKIKLILAAAALLVALAAFCHGYFLPGDLSDKAAEFFRDYLKRVPFTFWGILLNNLAAALVLFAGGFLLALPSLASYYINFIVLGLVFRMSVDGGYALRFAAGILPHGIFEIPAIIISFVLGLSLAAALVRRITGRDKGQIRPTLIRLAKTFGWIVIPLIVIAALMEVTVTPLVLKAL